MSDCKNYVSEEDIKALKESELHIEHVARSRNLAGEKVLSVTDTIRGDKVTNRTLDGLEELYQNSLSNIGYQQMGDYKPGITIDGRNQIVFENGSWYIYRGDLPHVTTGTSLAEDGGIWSEENPNGQWVNVNYDNFSNQRIFKKIGQKIQLTDYPSILDFDGVYVDDESKDSSEGILEAIQKESTLYFPPGVYRVDKTIESKPGGLIIFDKNATLIRLKKYSSSTSPVFSLRGQYSESIGGRFITENNHPFGVVTCGHNSDQDSKNALCWRLIRPYIKGVKEIGNIGLNIPSGQINIGTSSANYFGYIDNPIVQNADELIVFNEIANGHCIISPQLYKGITSGISFYGAYGNHVVGGFLHTSDNGVIGINLKNRRFENTHHSNNNQIEGFSVEPGGDRSKALFIDTECIRNRINIMGNVAGGVTVLNNKNDYDTTYIKSSFNNNIRELKVFDKIVVQNKSQFFQSKKDVPENKKELFFRIEIPSNGGGHLLELILLAKSSSLDFTLPVILLIGVNNRTGVLNIEKIDEKSSSHKSGDISYSTNGNILEIYGTSRNNGTNTIYKNLSMSLTVTSNDESLLNVTG
ncbi:tail spike protein [Proteus phage vB_PmiP_RS10pmA]|nr:tail spike protein [Proteus phage vB_PmiP_RS10pmA]